MSPGRNTAQSPECPVHVSHQRETLVAHSSCIRLQVVALDCLLHHRSQHIPLSVGSIHVQLALPLCILVLFVLYFSCRYTWRKFLGRQQPRNVLSKQLKVSTYAVLGFFYTLLTQASLNIFSCYQIDAPTPSGTLYAENLQVSLLPALIQNHTVDWRFLKKSIGPAVVHWFVPQYVALCMYCMQVQSISNICSVGAMLLHDQSTLL